MTRNLRPLEKTEYIIDSFECDVCHATIHDGISPFEFQERLSIDFTGGYGSVFGDGNRIECDICQQCVDKLLGPYLRVMDNVIW